MLTDRCSAACNGAGQIFLLTFTIPWVCLFSTFFLHVVVEHCHFYPLPIFPVCLVVPSVFANFVKLPALRAKIMKHLFVILVVKAQVRFLPMFENATVHAFCPIPCIALLGCLKCDFKQIFICVFVFDNLLYEIWLKWEPYWATHLEEICGWKPWDGVCEKTLLEMVPSPIPIAMSVVNKNFTNRFRDFFVKFDWKSEINIPDHVTELTLLFVVSPFENCFGRLLVLPQLCLRFDWRHCDDVSRHIRSFITFPVPIACVHEAMQSFGIHCSQMSLEHGFVEWFVRFIFVDPYKKFCSTFHFHCHLALLGFFILILIVFLSHVTVLIDILTVFRVVNLIIFVHHAQHQHTQSVCLNIKFYAFLSVCCQTVIQFGPHCWLFLPEVCHSFDVFFKFCATHHHGGNEASPFTK